MQHWINKAGDYVFSADQHNAMPFTTGCKKITKEEYDEFRLNHQGPSFEGRTRKPKKSKEERRIARLARRKKKMEA